MQYRDTWINDAWVSKPVMAICIQSVLLLLLLCLLAPVGVLASADSDCGASSSTEQVIKCYLPFIVETARKWEVEPGLVLAIIHQESRFDLRARSRSNALGLMQVVPASGGRDVMRFVTGEAITLPDEMVLEPKRNIELGVAFLHLLKYRYLAGIKDAAARRYAVVAAYNGGIGTLRRWYGVTDLSLIERINSNSAESFKSAILWNHPYAETRDYLRRVDGHYQFYQKLLQRHIDQ